MTTKTLEELAESIVIQYKNYLIDDDLNHLRDQIIAAIANERAARVVSESDILKIFAKEYNCEINSFGKLESISCASLSNAMEAEKTWIAGFHKATKLNSIVALDKLLPSERDYRDFLYDKEKHVGQFPILNWIKSYLKEKLGKK